MACALNIQHVWFSKVLCVLMCFYVVLWLFWLFWVYNGPRGVRVNIWSWILLLGLGVFVVIYSLKDGKNAPVPPLIP